MTLLVFDPIEKFSNLFSITAHPSGFDEQVFHLLPFLGVGPSVFLDDLPSLTPIYLLDDVTQDLLLSLLKRSPLSFALGVSSLISI